MSKTLSFLVVLLIVGCTADDPIPTYEYIIIPEKVRLVKVEGETQADLFTKANAWAVSASMNGKVQIQFKRRKSGVLLGRLLVTGDSAVRDYSTLHVKVQDGTARVSADIGEMIITTADSVPSLVYPTLEDVHHNLDATLDSFETAIKEAGGDLKL